MNNLALHNKLLQIAKRVYELKSQHPELANEIASLEHLLEATPTVVQDRPASQSPYRNTF